MLKKETDSKWKLVCFILVTILVFGGLFMNITKQNIKDNSQKLEVKVSDLEEMNAKLSDNINELNANVESKIVGADDELSKKFIEVSNEFIKLYPIFDIEKVEEKRSNLEKIATESVASSIVPEDMIESSKRTLESSSSSQKSQVYSSDPTFKSKYKSSTIYTRFVNSEIVQYFAVVNYETESSSGDTEDTVYLLFDVSNKDGKVQVINYEIKYFN